MLMYSAQICYLLFNLKGGSQLHSLVFQLILLCGKDAAVVTKHRTDSAMESVTPTVQSPCMIIKSTSVTTEI